MTQQLPTRRARPAFSIPSILALLCAIGSFMTGAGIGFVLAILAIIFGGVGVMLAITPQTRGGVMSIVSILLGAIGIIAAVVKLIM
jgi:hypothetical protein